MYEIVSTRAHIQLPRANLFRIDISKVGPISVASDHLNHIMRRTTTNLDNGKRVLFSLPRFLSVTVKVDTSERFHRLIIK